MSSSILVVFSLITVINVITLGLSYWLLIENRKLADTILDELRKP